MAEIFPEPIRNLPEADIPFDGVKAYLSQGEDHQILFMEYTKDAQLPEHWHQAEWGMVVAGKIDLTIEGVKRTYSKGDTIFIPKGAKHFKKIYAGYADVTFFAQKDRYPIKKNK